MDDDWTRAYRRGRALHRDLMEFTEGRTCTLPATRMFASGAEEITHSMGYFESRTRRSVWNFRVAPIFDSDGFIEELDARSNARGLRSTDVITPHVYESCRVPGLIPPETVLGPAAFQGIILDARTFLFAGPPTPAGRPTGWVTQHPGVMGRARALWAEILRLAKPIPMRDCPSAEDLRVAKLLARGHTNRQIATMLSISTRTLDRRIATLERQLKVSDRAELAALIASSGR